MPELTLAICIHREHDLLQRLLTHAESCYADLVVAHDGLDDTGVRGLVESYGGRFFERPRRHQQEPHWPFLWRRAAHDWVLRWDADEFPSGELKEWLQAFRRLPELPADISGYTCIWPLWDGRRARTSRWPRRVMLVHRQRIRYFGVPDQGPIPDGRFEPLELVLHHQPKSKSYGIRYTLTRPKVRRWHVEIARSLLGKPTDLSCWRWKDHAWPRKWEEIRRRPLLTGLKRLVLSPIGNAREMVQHGELPRPSILTTFPLQHLMTCVAYYRLRAQQRRLGKTAL
jgi:hypothetical protein